jgi:general secretion pathway protein E
MTTPIRSASKRMAYLEFETSEGPFQFEITGDTVTIGRHPDNDIVVRDERSSRFHCVVERAKGGYRLRDLRSRNGTKLDEERVDQAAVRSGAVIRIGDTELKFVDPDESRRRPARRPPVKSPARPTPQPEPPAESIRLEEAPEEAPEPPRSPMSALEELSDPLNGMRDRGKHYKGLPSYAQEIMQIIDAVPDRSLSVEDITLVDTAGVTRHAGRHKGIDDRKASGSEAIFTLRLLLLACFRCRATDLHMEPKRGFVNVRIRVDGFLVRLATVPNALAERIKGAIKILCNIDTSQHRIVQEGHFSVTVPDRHVDYRVSFTPSVHGQNMVIRVLDGTAAPSNLGRLGMVDYMYKRIQRVTRQDSGLLMVCGPTGSGKTTTLYAVLREIDREQRNVITIEDPVELQIDGVTQLPVNEDRGNSFSGLLRSVLRQDPDVLLVGEIRDVETARTAMQASMTGHVVLTTVHARDTIGSIFRLIDLGVEPYLVANALNMVLAQRLVRSLCPHCKKPVALTPQQIMAMGRFCNSKNEIMAPVGCRRCLRTGFIGRHAIFELLLFTDELRDVILKQPTIQAMRRVIAGGLFTTLQESAFQFVSRGLTSYSEAERVAGTVEGA